MDDLNGVKQAKADGFASGMRLPLGATPGGPYVPGVCRRGIGCPACDHQGARMRHEQWMAGFRDAQASRIGKAINLD